MLPCVRLFLHLEQLNFVKFYSTFFSFGLYTFKESALLYAE